MKPYTYTSFNNEECIKYWKNQSLPDFENLVLTNGKFEDPYFPPNDNSIFSKDADNNYIDKIKGQENETKLTTAVPVKITWKRATNYKPVWSVFGKEVSPSQIQQGHLGNCYLLALLASLAQYPPVIRHIFRTVNFNRNGFYELQLYINGEWQAVFVDDNFPFIEEKNTFAFARPSLNELWVMLIEKAFAKICGGYSNIQGGTSAEIIQILTGFCGTYILNQKISTRDKDIVPAEIYTNIDTCVKDKAILTAATINDPAILEKHLNDSHDYSVIDTVKIEEAKDTIYLIKLKNPWGTNEVYSDFGNINQKTIAEYKTYNENSTDGTFWIDLDSYMKYFVGTYVTRLIFNSKVKIYKFYEAKYFAYPVVFNMILKEKCSVLFNIIFKDKKINFEDTREDDSKHPVFFVLSQWDKSNNNLIKSFSRYELENNLTFYENLDEGNYIVWIYVPMNLIKNEKNFFYNFVICSSKNFNIKLISSDKKFSFISRMVLEQFKLTPPPEPVQGKKDSQVAASPDVKLDFDSKILNGFITIVIENKLQNKWAEILTTLDYNSAILLPPFTDKQQVILTLPPARSKVLIAHIEKPGEVSMNVTIEPTCEKRKQFIPPDDLPKIIEQFLRFGKLDEVKEVPSLYVTFRYLTYEPPKETIENKEDNEELSKQPEVKGVSNSKGVPDNKGNKGPADNKGVENSNVNNEPKEETPKPKPKPKPKISASSDRPKITFLNLKGREAIIKKLFYNLDIPKFKPLLVNIYPKEIKILLEKYTVLTLNEDEELWLQTEDEFGSYIKVYTFNTERGIFFYKNNDMKYIGYLKDGKLCGKGELLTNEYKIIYEGNFENNKKNGIGKLFLKNGDVYEGMFKDDMFHGKGKYTYANGNSWEGSFLMGEKNGTGVTIDKVPKLSDERKKMKSKGKNKK